MSANNTFLTSSLMRAGSFMEGQRPVTYEQRWQRSAVRTQHGLYVKWVTKDFCENLYTCPERNRFPLDTEIHPLFYIALMRAVCA